MQILKAFFLALLLICPAHAKKLQSENLTQFKKKHYRPVQNFKSVKPKGMSSNRSSLVYFGPEEQREEKELKIYIEGIAEILKRKPKLKQRVALRVNRANVALALARIYRIRSDKKTISSVERKYLKMAVRDARYALKSNTKDPQVKALALYADGVASAELGLKSRAISSFTRALKLNASSPPARVLMSLYLAESYFERSRYVKAIQHYQKYAKHYNPAQRRLASYYTAWSYLNLKKFQKAEKFYVEVIKETQDDGIGKDSFRDLAYTLSLGKRSEGEIIQLARELFSHSEKRKDFYDQIYTHFLREGRGHQAKKIFDLLIELETDPRKRIQLYFERLQPQKRQYASLVHRKAFLDLQGSLKKNGLSPESEEFSEIEGDFERETEMIIRSYVETLSGRTKTPEKISKKKMGKHLQKFFSIYHFWFPSGKKIHVISKLWVDVCLEVNDPVCTYEVSGQILDNDNLKSIHDRVWVDRLAALELLAKRDSEKYEGEFIVHLEEFVRSKEDSKDWTPLAERLSGYYLRAGNYPKAEKIIDQIYQRQKTLDSFYRTLWVRFEQKKYDDLMKKAESDLKFRKSKKIRKILFDTAQNLASKAETEGAFESYEKNILKMLSYRPGKKRALLVKQNYFSNLSKNKKHDQLEKELLKLSWKRRLGKGIVDYTRSRVSALLEAGEFQRANILLLKGKPPKVISPLLYEQAISQLGSRQTIDLSELQRLAKKDQKYLLGLLVLTRPRFVKEFFKRRKNLTELEKRQAWVALQIDSGKFEPRVGKSWRKVLGDVVPTHLHPVSLLPSEKSVRQVRLPKGKTPLQIAQVVEKVRKIRSQVTQDLKGQIYLVQSRVLASVVKLEKKTAEVITSSPVPEGLTQEEKEEYKNGLQTAAKEFADQANEFEEIRRKVLSKKKEEEKKRREKLLSMPDLDDWPWPEEEGLEEIRNLKNTLAALIRLDFLKANGKISVEDYFALRTGTLLKSSSTEAMRMYLRTELEENKQVDLVSEWKDLVE